LQRQARFTSLQSQSSEERRQMNICENLPEIFFQLDQEILSMQLQGKSTVTLTHDEVITIMNLLSEIQNRINHFPDFLSEIKAA
jgi:hypothetical protein